jgi:putative sigma-54 modulation protein
MPSIVVTGRDDSVTTLHKQHAQAKIAKLERYFDGIVKIETILGHGRGEAEVEVVLSVRGGNPLVCHARAKDLYAAIDIVLDKAEAQLTRHKEKLQSRKVEGRRFTPREEEVIEPEEPPA